MAITDLAWFKYLAALGPLEEVNFWQPSVRRPITLPLGAPWLFKLHAGDGGWVVGGGYFAHYTTTTPRFAWDTFGQGNGAPSFEEMLRRITRYTRGAIDQYATSIGASILVQPFFLPRELWIQPPADWSPNLVQGRTYDTEVGEGQGLWQRLQGSLAAATAPIPAVRDAPAAAYGDPVMIRPRLGQGTFRVMVMDAYERRCVVTNDRTIPVLEAAHIKPFSQAGAHEVSNGLLFRSDLHRLFDLGYVTVTPDLRLRVSRRIHDEFQNGRDCYALDRLPIRMPAAPNPAPSRDLLQWHADTVFRG